MNSEQIVRETLNAANARDMIKSASYMAEDMRVTGHVPIPLNKSQFVELNNVVFAAFPDWAFNIQALNEQGNQVIVRTRNTGTHTGTLSLALLGMPQISPTHRAVAVDDTYIFTVRDGRIAEIYFDSPQDGGFPALLKQIGVQLPA